MDYSHKLRRLSDRRQGLYSRDGTYSFVEALSAVRKSERYEQIAEPEAVKYAVGAMQAVDAAYTEESYAEGGRVRDRLSEGLTGAQVPATFEFQGSVPLDVHVRGNSDVDLLVLHGGFVTADQDVWTAYQYVSLGTSSLDDLAKLRKECVSILERRYYSAKVDATSSKAITVSGGSLKRFVDVVPSHWHDTLLWKATNDVRHRDVYVLDSKAGVRVKNRPFMHIATIRAKCDMVSGALRKSIRLLKNLRYDASKKIDLSSYDIAAISWNMTENELTVPYGVDLLLVERVRRHLQVVVESAAYRDLLWVPDGSRKIFDKPEKVVAAAALYKELERLSNDIATELSPLNRLADVDRSYVLNKAIFL